MRKTARPVVWEGAGAQSPAPDPIDYANWPTKRQRPFGRREGSEMVLETGATPVLLGSVPWLVAHRQVFWHPHRLLHARLQVFQNRTFREATRHAVPNRRAGDRQ